MSVRFEKLDGEKLYFTDWAWSINTDASISKIVSEIVSDEFEKNPPKITIMPDREVHTLYMYDILGEEDYAFTVPLKKLFDDIDPCDYEIEDLNSFVVFLREMADKFEQKSL